MLLTKLTKEQTEKFPFYVEKWIKIGLSTERADRIISERAIKKLYALAKLKEPKIIWCPCPVSGAIAALFIGSAVHSAVDSAVHSAVYSAVDSAVHSAVNLAVHSAVHSAVNLAVHSAVHSAVNLAVESAVYSAVYLAVHSAVDSAVHSAVRNLTESDGLSYFGGSLWAGYSAWADFFNQECGIKIDRSFLDLVQNCGFYFCLDGFCIATEKPVEINLKNGRLHKDGGMVIAYESGWGIFALNGVVVPRDVSETPAEKLDAKMILSEKNAEVRREIVRKIGIERICMDLGAKVIDSESDYELLFLELGDGRVRPYLKMKNPSTGTYHIEGVHQDCFTVKKALTWRNQSEETPVVLT